MYIFCGNLNSPILTECKLAKFSWVKTARETIGRVIGGTVAEQILDLYNIKIIAYVTQIGHIKAVNINENTIDRNIVDQFITRCPDEIISKQMEEYILDLKKKVIQ